MYIRYDNNYDNDFDQSPMYVPEDTRVQKSTMRFARAYIINQPYVGISPLDVALKRGNLFPNLYLPYEIGSKGNNL